MFFRGLSSCSCGVTLGLLCPDHQYINSGLWAPIELVQGGRGGTGRRAALRALWEQSLESSSLSDRTKIPHLCLTPYQGSRARDIFPYRFSIRDI